MISVDEALSRILAAARPAGSEHIPVEAACGRILSSDVLAQRDQPPADSSAMDGFAVRAADLTAFPARLEIIGEAPAGKAYAGKLEAGQAVRIFTGGIVPEGADSVVIQEDTAEGGDVSSGFVTVEDRAASSQTPGRHIRARGNDFSAGDILVRAGKRLSPRDIALIAAGNKAEVEVARRSVVAVLSTGDELVAPGAAKGPEQIVNSNTPMLQALLAHAGADVRAIGVARDDEAELRAAIDSARDADVLVTIGGASVGTRDLVQGVLKDAGFVLDFWKIRMRPGKPVIFGTLDGMPVLGLPGNPVSAMVGAYLFLLPLIDRMCGCTTPLLATAKAHLTQDMEANGPRRAYLRATMALDDSGQLTATPLQDQDSAGLSGLSQAEGLIIRPGGAEACPAGSLAPVLLFTSLDLF